MTRKRLLALPFALLAVAAFGGTVWATMGQGVSTENLLPQPITFQDDLDVKTSHIKLKTKGSSDLHIVRNRFAPGGHSGWHTHPGPSLISVTSGTIVAYEGEDCERRVYTAPAGFVDTGDGHSHILVNETDAPAETVAVQILPQGAPRRTDAQEPQAC